MYVCMYVCMYVQCMYVYICMYVCMYVCHMFFFGIFGIIIYKLGDVSISSSLIGSLSLTNGQCTPPGEVDNETMVSVNSRFAEVIENDILRMHDTASPNNTKKAIKLGMKFSEIKLF